MYSFIKWLYCKKEEKEKMKSEDIIDFVCKESVFKKARLIYVMFEKVNNKYKYITPKNAPVDAQSPEQALSMFVVRLLRRGPVRYKNKTYSLGQRALLINTIQQNNDWDTAE